MIWPCNTVLTGGMHDHVLQCWQVECTTTWFQRSDKCQYVCLIWLHQLSLVITEYVALLILRVSFKYFLNYFLYIFYPESSGVSLCFYICICLWAIHLLEIVFVTFCLAEDARQIGNPEPYTHTHTHTRTQALTHARTRALKKTKKKRKKIN